MVLTKNQQQKIN